jgi:hypothetical protein
MKDETIRYMIFDCSFARVVWFSSPLQVRTPNLPIDVKEAVLVLLSALNPMDKKMAGYLAWEIWKARNRFNFKNELPDPRKIMHQALPLTRIRKTPENISSTAHPTPTRQDTHNVDFQLQGVENLSYAVVDASFDQNGKAGAGMAYYTSSDHLQLVYFSPIEVITSFQAEAKAVKLAIPNWSSPYFQNRKKYLPIASTLLIS